MSDLKGTNDEKAAIGAVVGGVANLVGPTATTMVSKAIGVKCAGYFATKIAAGTAIACPPAGALLAIGAGLAWLTYKSCK